MSEDILFFLNLLFFGELHGKFYYELFSFSVVSAIVQEYEWPKESLFCFNDLLVMKSFLLILIAQESCVKFLVKLTL